MNSFMLEARLNFLGIPYEKRGGLKFMEHKCIIDMLAYLRCLTNPYDELAWFRILQLHPGIGDTYARRISQNAESNKNFLLEAAYKKKKFYGELSLLNTEMIKVQKMEFVQQFDDLVQFYHDVRKRAIEKMDTKDEGNRTDAFETLEMDMGVLSVLRNMIIKYDTALAFLDAIALDSMPETENADDKLVISTIHSAKGLEWNTVFIMDCVDGVFPGIMPDEIETQKDMEELRCFYVAVTRAKEKLHIICPKWVAQYGHGIPGEIAHYLTGCESVYMLKEE